MPNSKKNAEAVPDSVAEQTEQGINEAEFENIEEIPEARVSRRRIGAHTAAERSLSPAEYREEQELRDIKVEELRSAIYNKTILRNKVASVQEYNLKGYRMMVLAFPITNTIKAIIPYSKTFMNDPIDMTTVDTKSDDGMNDYLTRQRQFLEQMNGSETRWLPEDIIVEDDGNHITVVGSRKAALAIDRNTYYLRPNANIKDKHTYLGKIVFVRKHSALVILGGLEKVIRQNHLTNRYCADLRDTFHPNDPVSIAVRDLEIHSDGNIDVTFDCLSGELIEAQKRIGSIAKNELTFATISKAVPYKDKDGNDRTRLYAWLDGWDVPAIITGLPYNRYGIEAKPGDQVRVKVTGVNEEGYVTCFVRSSHNSSGL